MNDWEGKEAKKIARPVKISAEVVSGHSSKMDITTGRRRRRMIRIFTKLAIDRRILLISRLFNQFG